MKLSRFLVKLIYYIKNFHQSGGIINVFKFFLASLFKITAPIYTVLGRKSKYCPCCNWKGAHFLPYIDLGAVTFEAVCPSCRSQARHRGHRLFYEKNFNNIKGNLLYIAPEENLKYFQKNSNLSVKTSEYSEETFADFHYDLEHIDSPSFYWDYIICHRVIEHISDDRKGMQELYRILKKGGFCILSVPIDQNVYKTIRYDAPNPHESLHYYSYGNDFVLRIPSLFKIQVYDFRKMFTKEEFKSMCLFDDLLFLCRK